MRTQLFNLTDPVQQNLIWQFEFATESEGMFGDALDPTQVLRSDSTGVPMIVDLDNQPGIPSVIITDGTDQNIWFEPMYINN